MTTEPLTPQSLAALARETLGYEHPNTCSLPAACARIRELLGLPPKSATAAPKDGR